MHAVSDNDGELNDYVTPKSDRRLSQQSQKTLLKAAQKNSQKISKK